VTVTGRSDVSQSKVQTVETTAPSSTEEVEPPTERGRLAILQRVAATALVLAPAVIVTWAFRPGYMNADTLTEYAVTQGKPLTDWHAPVIERLWDAADALGAGRPTGIVFAQALVLTCGLYLVMRARLGRLAAAIVSAVLFFSPPVFSQIMLLGRDTWLACFVVLQVGLLVRWTETTGKRSTAILAGSVACGVLAIAARQNGAALVLFVFIATAARWRARRAGDAGPARRSVRTVLAGPALGLGMTVVAIAGLNLAIRALGAQDLKPEAVLYAYDLAGMSLQTDEVLLGPEAFPEQDIDILRQTWHDQTVNYLLVPTEDPLVHAMGNPPEGADELADDWRDEVPRHLGAYLEVRWTLYSRIIGLSAPNTYVMHGGIDANPYGFALANPDANDAFRDYMSVFSPGDNFAVGSAMFRPIFYMVLALVASVVLLTGRRRTAPGGLEVGLVAIGALAYEGTFLFLAMGETFRYSYPMIAIAMLAGVFAVASAAVRTPGEAPSEPTSASDELDRRPGPDRSPAQSSVLGVATA
jgi:hypothetical protein